MCCGTINAPPVFHIRQFFMLPNYHYLVTAFGEPASSLCSCYTVVCFNLWVYSYFPRYHFDTMQLVFPPVPAGIIVLILYLPIAHLLPLSVGRALLAGGLLGYIGYDLTHYYLHHGSPTPGSYFASLKTYHVAHHYINYNQGLCTCVLAHNIRDTYACPLPTPTPSTRY